MKVYTVHEQPYPQAARLDRIDRAQFIQFVPDGFSLEAALFAPISLLAHKLYEGLALYTIALLAIIAVLKSIGISHVGFALAIAALHIITGFEFGELQRTHLASKGWTDLGVIGGSSLAQCERRFFEDWLPRQPLIATQQTANTTNPPDQQQSASNPSQVATTMSPSSPERPRWRDKLSPWRPGTR